MLIPVLDIAGEQIAWIDHLKLGEGELFRDGNMLFRLVDGTILQGVRVTVLERGTMIDVAVTDQ